MGSSGSPFFLPSLTIKPRSCVQLSDCLPSFHPCSARSRDHAEADLMELRPSLSERITAQQNARPFVFAWKRHFEFEIRLTFTLMFQ